MSIYKALRSLIIWSVIFSQSVSTAAFASTPDSQNNRNKISGIILYNQLKIDAAIPQLEKDAEAGDIDSQYYLGEALRKRNRYMTREAQQWYGKAANNGSIFAMIQLGRQNNDLCKKMNNCPPLAKNQAPNG